MFSLDCYLDKQHVKNLAQGVGLVQSKDMYRKKALSEQQTTPNSTEKVETYLSFIGSDSLTSLMEVEPDDL